MITISLYLGLPLPWSGMMAWAGVNVGRSLDNGMHPFIEPANDSGQKGGSVGKAVVSKGVKK